MPGAQMTGRRLKGHFGLALACDRVVTASWFQNERTLKIDRVTGSFASRLMAKRAVVFSCLVSFDAQMTGVIQITDWQNH
jgi:hypothetical protein